MYAHTIWRSLPYRAERSSRYGKDRDLGSWQQCSVQQRRYGYGDSPGSLPSDYMEGVNCW